MNDCGLKIFVVTSPAHIENEAEKIVRLFEAGIYCVHLRKPDWSLPEVKHLIEDIPYEFRKRLKLHGHFELLNEMNLGGAHLNKRNPKAPYTAKGISISCHSINEIKYLESVDYCFLSPVFDSISKQGYTGESKLLDFKNFVDYNKVVALGGVKPEKFLLLKEKGFWGAGLLGYIWENDFEEALRKLKS